MQQVTSSGTTAQPGATTGTQVKAAATADPLEGKITGKESSLSNYVGPYVTEMLGRGQALAGMPYQAYQGPLTAGQSDLQSQAFTGLAGFPSVNSTITIVDRNITKTVVAVIITSYLLLPT